MNDFLQSIRNGSFSKDNGNNGKPRYNNQRPRRAYEPNGNYTRNNNGNEQKFRPRTPGNNVMTDETLAGIKDTLTGILANQEAALAFAERRAIAEERKADAFEFIAAHIGRLSGDTFVTQVHEAVRADMDTPDDEPILNVAGPAASDLKEIAPADMNKDDILELIASMRRDGSTYNEIASHLVELNLPTFSGRGKWHAQTIHRLCQTA
ncbi:hypothetical protein JCM14469_31900 [Desulfatiferula olefinivorans]